MEKVCFLIGLVLFLVSTVSFTVLTSASEVRTLELFPIADSFVSVSSPQSNFGSELHLRTEYEERTVIRSTSFDISAANRRVLDVSLPKNGMINGSLDVDDGGDIDFRIRNEDENVTYVEEFSVKSLNFYFFAPYTGNYHLIFENVGLSMPTTTVSLSDVVLTIEPFGVVCSPVFLLFDLSIIPPDATIETANLSLSFKAAGTNSYNIVKAFYCCRIDWSEQLITLENAPLTQSCLTESCSVNMSSGMLAGTRLQIDIRSDVARGLITGRLTEAIAIVGGELPVGMLEFYSRESESEPKLEITYTYASASCSLSSAFLIEGQSVTTNVTTDPAQTSGRVRIQYSTDQVNWVDAGDSPGGATCHAWTPPAGQIYVRGVWEISLSGGSYYALSSVQTVFVIPIYLLVLIVGAIIAAVIGVYRWRRKRQMNPPHP